jgi:uncharacterized protein
VIATVSLQIDVRDLVGHPGSSRSIHLAEPVPGLATELAAVPEDRDVDGELLLESVVEGILVSGPLEGRMQLRCARCLREFDAPFELVVQELFVARDAGREEPYPLDEGVVDLEPMIRDAVILAMPFAPLCRPDCLGLCERCGGDRNVGECTCPPDSDPRWSALADLRLDLPDERS